MEGKLIKVENGYVLMVNNIMYATDNDKLSLKNCEAIANGYDLDELAFNYAESKTPIGHTWWTYTQHFKEGFQKALELLGDKKFSEGDLREAISQTRKGMLYNKKYEDEYIQSLQQTEWDVIVETYIYSEMDGRGGFSERRPKLDEEGCLILKRV